MIVLTAHMGGGVEHQGWEGVGVGWGGVGGRGERGLLRGGGNYLGGTQSNKCTGIASAWRLGPWRG
jgi:hypothetical protein